MLLRLLLRLLLLGRLLLLFLPGLLLLLLLGRFRHSRRRRGRWVLRLPLAHQSRDLGLGRSVRRQQFHHLAIATAVSTSIHIGMRAGARVGRKAAAAAVQLGGQLDRAARHRQLEARTLLGGRGGGKGQPAERVTLGV